VAPKYVLTSKPYNIFIALDNKISNGAFILKGKKVVHEIKAN